MAIIVTDTSPIRALHHLQHLALISQLFGSLVVPFSVDLELRVPRASFSTIDLGQLGIGSVRAASQASIARVAVHQLDPGETEAIALAIDISADYLLIDEMAGRRTAHRLGLKYIGVFGVLLEAKRRGAIPRVAPLVARLRKELRFHIHPEFERNTLATVGETPEA